jgi:hemolysin D
MRHELQAAGDLAARYGRVIRGSWRERADRDGHKRMPLERQFLPATLEILETPAPAAPRVLIWVIAVAFVTALVWSIIGRVDVVAVAHGKIIPSDRVKVIQPLETAVVRRIHVTDGQQVRAGEVLIELDATGSDADVSRIREEWLSARLEATRWHAFLDAMEGRPAPALNLVVKEAPAPMVARESRLLRSQVAEFRARMAALDAEIARRQAEIASTRELVAKMEETVPIARKRADDLKRLVDQKFASEHVYLEREQVRIEQERDLAFQRSRVRELDEALREAQRKQDAYAAEARRAATDAATLAERRSAVLGQDLNKAARRSQLMQLASPVDGTVQQLSVHTIGGVVSEAQPLMVIVPAESAVEVDVAIENKDVGFIRPGQVAQLKLETFPFTRYGTVPGTVRFVSQDAVMDEKRPSVFQARLAPDKSSITVDERVVALTAGMAVQAEIRTGGRRVIDYLLEPLRATAQQSIREP